MIAFLLIPLLVCGYILLTTLPSEKVRLSLYTGWSLYLRAATYGFFTFLLTALIFSAILPFIGRLIGIIPALAILPDTNLISIISEAIESILTLDDNASNYQLYLYLTSLSLITCTLLLIFNLTINNLPWCKRKSATREVDNIEKMFAKHSPLEYTLFIIGKNYQEVFKYNYQISKLREKSYEKYKNNEITDEEIRKI